MTDSELIHAILQNDESLFNELINRYKKQVIGTCYGFTQSIQDAEDIAQEVFIEVFESLSSFRHESKFSTWIYRISVNKSLNYLRKKKQRGFMQSLEELLLGKKSSATIDRIDDKPLPDDFTDPDFEVKLLQSSLQKIPKNQQTALTLYTYQELSYKQISEIMGVSLSSVESLIFRAKKSLRKLMVEHYDSCI